MIGLASPEEEAKTLIDRVRAFLFKGSVENGGLPYEALKVHYFYAIHRNQTYLAILYTSIFAHHTYLLCSCGRFSLIF
jgi:hypothetical protein